MSYLSCTQAAFGYEGRSIVRNVNFTVNQGEYLCIVGENGAGKSTLMKGILGLIPPMEGAVTYEGGITRKDIGYLPQQSEIQKDFPASVMEIVSTGTLSSMGHRPFYGKKEKRMAMDAMDKLNITHLRNRGFHELSGGQKQRVLLARAFCQSKKILVMDEPVTGLDPLVTQEFYELTMELAKSGTAVIMISHDIPSVIRYGTHILHLTGSNIYYGTIEAYLKSETGKLFLMEVDHGTV